jgi:hypothetical protein
VHHFGGYEPRSRVPLLRFAPAWLRKGMEEKDNPAPVFSGETKDWPTFKDAIQMRADKHDTTWLFEGGRSLAEFLARQIKEKTGSDKKARKKALEREKVASDSNHVPTSVDAYTDDALKEWFADRDIATGLLLSLNKNRLSNLGSNFTDYKRLGFPNEAALTQAHKSLDLKYLRELNRMAARLLHDAGFEPSSKVGTAAQTKLNGILRNSEVSQILRGAVDDDDGEWLDQPWKIPALQIWAKMYHKYEGMTDMLTGTMMEELATIITCVTGDARHRRTIYEADQDFERFGKTLIANFKDTATLWEFLRASLRQCHIHKLSKVRKDKAAWAKADEYLTNLMDSDTVLTLDNTDEAIKRAQNYMQRQDNDGEKRVAFSSASDESNDDHEEVKALRAALKEKALEAKFDSCRFGGEFGGARYGGVRCGGAGKRIAICCTTQGAPRPERLQTSQTWQGRAFRCRASISEPQLLAQALVHHKFVMDLPDGIWIDEKTGKTAPCRVMAVKAYSRTQAKFWYVDFTIISHADRCDLQLPVRRGTVKSVNHAMNLQDLFRQLFNHPSTLEDLGITEERSKQIMSATIDAWRDSLQNPFALACVLSSQINAADAQRKEQEQAAAATRSAAIERKALEEARARGPPAGHFKQVMETCEPLDTIFDEIDLLEDDPPHRGVAMRNARFRPYWIQAEEKEWQGLWEKGVFKKWSRKDLLSNDRVFTSRYVYKLKRSAITGEVYRFKARLIVRGFQMEKGVDFDDSFSPTPGLAVGRFMLSLAVANDYELHACDIEQAFLQADKLPEGVNGRYFIPPPPGSPDANNRDVVYEVRRPLYGNPSSPRALHKTFDAYFMSEGFEHVGFEESVWVRPKGGKYGEDIYVSTHVDDCLICCKSTATMSKFKQELLTRFQGTDEGEVKEYLGCEVIRDRAARTGKMVQAGYAERVLRTFGMWNCNPVLTPLDPNVRLTRRDSPEVVDPRLHRRMRSIVGCLSYLVNMTRPDLAFTYSQLSKFVQSPGPVHLAAAERALAYLRGTYNEGITYCDPGEERRNKLTGWVDSDFAADPDTRKSMTGYLFSLNGGAVSWRSSRQGGVTLSSAEAEFVAASQAGQEAVYLRALLRGFNFRQVCATEIWEDKCLLYYDERKSR